MQKESDDEETDFQFKKDLASSHPHIYCQDATYDGVFLPSLAETRIADQMTEVEDEWMSKYFEMRKWFKIPQIYHKWLQNSIWTLAYMYTFRKFEDGHTEALTYSSSDESFQSDQDATSDVSTSEFSQNGSPIIGVPLYEEDLSSDSSFAEEDRPVTDTESCVFLWNCNNDLFPQVNSYYPDVLKTAFWRVIKGS